MIVTEFPKDASVAWYRKELSERLQLLLPAQDGRVRHYNVTRRRNKRTKGPIPVEIVTVGTRNTQNIILHLHGGGELAQAYAR
jgi:hypothetical protein